MADFNPSTKSFIYGLSDFWLTFFKEIDQLETMYRGAEINAGQAYLDLMALLLNNSVQDAVVFNKEFFKALIIDEDDLVYRLGATASKNVYRYTLPDNMVNGRYLNNKILAPTEAMERDVDYSTNSELYAFDFKFDPTNAYYERVFGELNNAFRVRAKVRGSLGASITVELVDDGTTPVTITRSAYALTIQYDGPANGNTSTAALIVQAINTKLDVGSLVVADIAGLGTGEGSPAAVGPTPLRRVSVNPLDGYAIRQVEKSYGGVLTMNTVDDWVAEGIEKGDVLRVISGAGVGVPQEYDIKLVRSNGLYVDGDTQFVESDDSVNYAILREPYDPVSEDEYFIQSGITTQSGVDGTIVAASSNFQSPTITLSPVHTGELIQILGVSNNGVGTILEVTSALSATIGGLALTDETPVNWELISILDPLNISNDGVLTNNGDGTGTFTSASAAFTAGAVGTVLRLHRAGALENYDIVGYADPNTITVSLDTSVSDGSSLDWGWARWKTPVHQVFFSPPVAWPTEDLLTVRARRAVDNQAVEEGTDYTVNVDTGRVSPLTVWKTSVSNTVSYAYRLAIKENVTALQSGANGTITPGSPNVFSSPTASFTAEHVGFAIRIANSGGNNNGTHIIAAVTGATTVELTGDKVVSSTPDPNNGSLDWELLGRGIATAGATTAFIRRMSVWAPDALVDRYNLYNTFGYLIDRFDRSSEEYRAFIRGIFQLFMLGPTLERFESAVNTVAGIPVIRDDGETLLSYASGTEQAGADGTFTYVGRRFTAPSATFTSSDAGSYIYAVNGPNAGRLIQIQSVLSTTELILAEDVTTGGPYSWELTSTGKQEVVTSRTTYTFARSIPMRSSVVDPTNYGTLTFRSFEVLTDVFTVTDYVEDPDWWEFVLIPEEVMPNATAARRQSTPRLFENVVAPADDGRVGDPGFLIGADSEGFVPPSTLVRNDGGAADGILTPDPLYPSSSVNTFFEAATAGFSLADLGNQVVVGGQGYRITEIVSATRVRIETFVPVAAASGLSWEIYSLPLPKRNKAAFVVIDKFLKYHLFTVGFDSSLLDFLRIDFFSDLQELVFQAKPTHTYIVLQPAALFDEVINVAEELSLATTIALGGLAGTTIIGNANSLLVIGSSWKVGSWFRYLSNSSNFAPPTAAVANPLGVPAAGYNHFVTKFDYDHTTFLSGGDVIQDADLLLRNTTDSGVAAEVTTAGTDAVVTVDGTVRDNMIMSYVALSGSGAGNNGVYRIGRVNPSTNELYVYAPGGLTAEAGLTWQLQTTGSLQGRVYHDSNMQTFFEDQTGTRPFTVADVGTYVRFPFACDAQATTYRIHELTGNPYVVRVATQNQVDPVEPGTVPASFDGTGTTLVLNNDGDVVFSKSMATETQDNSSRLYYVVVSSGPNNGERRLIQRWLSASSVMLGGAVLAADTAADIHVEVEVHYDVAVDCAYWEHVQQQVKIDAGTIDLSDTPAQDAGSVNYTAEGIREPDDPTVSTIDDANGDTLYSIGMQDPKANAGRSRTSRDVDLRDEPLEVTRV